MQQILIPIGLWSSILAALEERIARADYLEPDTYDDDEHEENCKDGAEEARKVLAEAQAVELPNSSEEAEARRLRIIELAEDANYIRPGEVEIDSDAILSEGEANGCYVSAWAWCDFSDTEFDKEKQLEPPVGRMGMAEPATEEERQEYNQRAAETARLALEAFAKETKTRTASDDEILTDLLTNLMHLADRESGLNFEELLASARNHFNCETEEID